MLQNENFSQPSRIAFFPSIELLGVNMRRHFCKILGQCPLPWNQRRIKVILSWNFRISFLQVDYWLVKPATVSKPYHFCCKLERSKDDRTRKYRMLLGTEIWKKIPSPPKPCLKRGSCDTIRWCCHLPSYADFNVRCTLSMLLKGTFRHRKERLDLSF